MTLLRCLAALTVGAALFVACGNDEEIVGGCDPCPPPHFESLTQRWHVLNNLQLAYNEREAARVDELLDQDFVFSLNPGDVGILPPQWGRAEELSITTMLFDPGLAMPGRPTCSWIRVDLSFEDGVTWADTVPPAFPTETWQMTTVYYNFLFTMEPYPTYSAMYNSRAQITIRNIGTEDAPQWRLVEWRDLVGGALLSTTATEPATWGTIKGLYYASTPTDVLRRLELAYDNRRTYQLGQLLDVNFAFFFSPGDVGGNIPEQWGRADEMSVSTLLFNPNLDDPNYPTCSSIDVDIQYESGVQWVEVVPESAPAETWYTTTVYYAFTFEMVPDVTYLAVPDARAQFTVRNAGTQDVPEWRLVEWRDLGAGALLAAVSTEPTTWGAVKALYSPGGGS